MIVQACFLIISITCEDSPFNLTTRESCSPPWPQAAQEHGWRGKEDLLGRGLPPGSWRRGRQEDLSDSRAGAAEASFLWSFLHELWSSPNFSRASSASEGFFTSSANASWRACHEGMTYTQPQVLGGCINQQGLWNCHATLAMLQKNREEVDDSKKHESRVCNSGLAECVDQSGKHT